MLDTIEADGLLDHVARARCAMAGASWPRSTRRSLAGVRGRGLWLALVVVDGDSAPAIETAAREHGFLVNATGADAVRLAPPLVLTDAEADSRSPAALPAILGAAAAATRLSA